MKRTWWVGRVVLAVALLAAAWCSFTFWVRGPRWSMRLPQERQCFLVGVQDDPGCVLVMRQESEGQSLLAYDLDDGTLRSVKPFRVPSERGIDCWPCALAPESGALVACSYVGDAVHVFSACPEKPLYSLTFSSRAALAPEGQLNGDQGEFPGFLCSYGFSPDGGAFVLHHYAFHDQFTVWDVRTGARLSRVVFEPQVPTSLNGIGPPNRLPTESAGLTSDGRFLIASLLEQAVVVYDLVAGREVLRERGYAARLSPDGGTLVCIPVGTWPVSLRSASGKPLIRYHRKGTSWVREEWGGNVLAGHEFLIEFGRDMFMTATEESPEPSNGQVLQQLPAYVRELYERLFERSQVRIRVRGLDGGSRGEVVVPTKARKSFLSVRIEMLWHGDVRTSASGGHLAVMQDGVLSIWDIPPRRPLVCWLTCAALVLLAGWVVWPRVARASAV